MDKHGILIAKLLDRRRRMDRRNVDKMLFLLLEEEPAKVVSKFEKCLLVRAGNRLPIIDGHNAKLMIMEELEYINKTKFNPPVKHLLLTKVTPTVPKYTSVQHPEVKILEDYINSKKHSKFCKTPITYFT